VHPTQAILSIFSMPTVNAWAVAAAIVAFLVYRVIRFAR
jgi:uncharacterized membrane protein YjfL (UPF0719 family)